jgi:hypothetical protein
MALVNTNKQDNRPYPTNDKIIEFVSDTYGDILGPSKKSPLHYICECTKPDLIDGIDTNASNQTIICILYLDDVIQKDDNLKKAFDAKLQKIEDEQFKKIEAELEKEISLNDKKEGPISAGVIVEEIKNTEEKAAEEIKKELLVDESETSGITIHRRVVKGSQGISKNTDEQLGKAMKGLEEVRKRLELTLKGK